jgi:hypothetical protein
MTLDDLVSQLRQVHGEALQAVVLYGSAATGEQVAGHSDLNVMAVTDTISFDVMRALGQTMRAWQEAGNPPVLELTTHEWRASADIFPMEYADIFERHRVLHGSLPLDGVAVRLSDLRLQVEQEAMGKLLRLRRGVMVAGTDPARQQELLRASLSSLLVIFRAVMRLHGERPPRDADQVIASVSRTCAFDPTPFTRVAALKRGTAIEARDTHALLEGYVTGMAALVAYLDRYTPPSDAAVLTPVIH